MFKEIVAIGIIFKDNKLGNLVFTKTLGSVVIKLIIFSLIIILQGQSCESTIVIIWSNLKSVKVICS